MNKSRTTSCLSIHHHSIPGMFSMLKVSCGNGYKHPGEDIESVANPTLTSCNRFSKCGRSGILYLHNLVGNPDERGLLIQEHLDTFAETFPRGCSVPGRVYVVPTMDRGLIPGSRIFQRHYPRLQTAMHSLHTKWNASMFRQNFRDEPEIAYNAVRNLMQDIAGV